MKPMMVLKPGAMSDAHMELLRENGMCVVVAENPADLKFVDPLPVCSSRTQIEKAAIRLSRIILAGHWGNYSSSNAIGRSEAARIYVDLLIEGTTLDVNGTTEEQENRIFSAAKRAELDRLGREEAKAERAKKKLAQADKKT